MPMGQRTVRLLRRVSVSGRLPPAAVRLVRENAVLRLAAGEPRPGALAASLLRLIDYVLPGCPCEVLIGDPRAGYLEVRGTRGFRAERGLGCRIPLGVGITGAAARRARPIWVPDVSADPRYIPGVARAHWELALPMCARGRVVGVIDLESAQQRRPTLRQRRYLAGITAAVAPAVARWLPGGSAAPLHALPSGAKGLAARQRDLEQLQTLMVNRRFSAAYQPVVELDGRRVVGYEAAVAAPKGTPWDTPARLLSAPRDAQFAAALDIARVQVALAGFRPGAGRLFLDIHPATLRRPGFAGVLQSLLRSHALSAGELVLELPDAGAHVEAVRRAAAAFRAAGVDLALDRFGAGAADVQALVDLRPAYVKLDAALVRGVERDFGRRTYIESLCYYTRRTGTAPVALGMATAEELNALRRCGVAYGQGELVGPATPLRA